MAKVIRDSAGKPFSKWKPSAKFEYVFQQTEYSDLFERCQREFEFDAFRKWRFDFAWPEIMLAVEIDGSSPSGFGRHQRHQGQADDNDKLNAAVAQGWRVVRFNSTNLGSAAKVASAVNLVIECILEWD